MARRSAPNGAARLPGKPGAARRASAAALFFLAAAVCAFAESPADEAESLLLRGLSLYLGREVSATDILSLDAAWGASVLRGIVEVYKYGAIGFELDVEGLRIRIIDSGSRHELHLR